MGKFGVFGVKQNYEDYERVKNAFKEFIHALVWESIDIDAGVQEEEIDEHIAKYCANNQDQMIAKANTDVTKFITSLEKRYEVIYYECGESGNVVFEECRISSDNLEMILKKAAEFYRKGKKPCVEVFDYETKKYVVKWKL